MTTRRLDEKNETKSNAKIMRQAFRRLMLFDWDGEGEECEEGGVT